MKPAVLKSLRRLTAYPISLREDLVHETLYCTFKKGIAACESGALDTSRADVELAVYLVTVARNSLLDVARRSHRPPLTIETDVMARSQTALLALVQEEEETIAKSNLQAALRRLSDDEQLLLRMWFFEEYSYRRIADTLKIRPGAARTRLHRALKKIRTALESG